jgi:uncharacterized protein (TIGR02996 family)
MNERDAFLKALAENEEDTTTRLVFADWLDEHGEHEEADRQRKWPGAKEWLVRFCEQHNPDPDEEDPCEWVISYEVLLELGREAVEEADKKGFGFSCGNNETMCDALRDSSREFWINWSVVTGIPLPPGGEDSGGFSCAC